jgi:Cytochrome P450
MSARTPRRLDLWAPGRSPERPAHRNWPADGSGSPFHATATTWAGSITVHPVSRSSRTRPSGRTSTPVSFLFSAVANPIDPGAVQLDRARNRHAAFGLGRHRCLGSSLARMELRVALEEWLARYPEFELSDPSAVTWSAGQVRGPRTLPVAIGRAGRSQPPAGA